MPARDSIYRVAMERYVIQGGRLGAERLAVLARTWWPTTEDLFKRVGLDVGMSCLDLGCGGGDVTVEMARRVGPTGRVTGVDMDEVKVGLARQAALNQDLVQIDWQVMNVYEWAAAPASFDFAYCRNLLQHLSRPKDLLADMWAAVKPGGVLAVEDADFEGSFCDPPHAGFQFWVETYQRVLEGHGGDPLTGRKLPRLFREAGIPEPDLRVVQRADLIGEAKTLPYSTVEATADAITSQGVATTEEVQHALEALAEFAEDTTSVCGSPRLFQAWTRKPTIAVPTSRL
jgi:SAM-dependent methyltransferase